jgi:hypothetical protein
MIPDKVPVVALLDNLNLLYGVSITITRQQGFG